jgi:WhiB family redox-sensing transcriptional regulator
MCNAHYLRWRRAEGRADVQYTPGTPHGFDAPPPPGPWVADGACRGAGTSLWFAERGDMATMRLAKATCDACPVRQPCGDYGLEHSSLNGMWGGLSERQRRLIRQQRRKAS